MGLLWWGEWGVADCFALCVGPFQVSFAAHSLVCRYLLMSATAPSLTPLHQMRSFVTKHQLHVYTKCQHVTCIMHIPIHPWPPIHRLPRLPPCCPRPLCRSLRSPRGSPCDEDTMSCQSSDNLIWIKCHAIYLSVLVAQPLFYRHMHTHVSVTCQTPPHPHPLPLRLCRILLPILIHPKVILVLSI